jgi:hypothetical protein
MMDVEYAEKEPAERDGQQQERHTVAAAAAAAAAATAPVPANGGRGWRCRLRHDDDVTISENSRRSQSKWLLIDGACEVTQQWLTRLVGEACEVLLGTFT